nr:hypothetical protein [uncultured Desulfobacter sp.]
MRSMKEEEIRKALSLGKWATICTVGTDMGPYGVEATYFIDVEASDRLPRLCFMINPRGTTMKNIGISPKVLLKLTLTDRNLKTWIGVSCFGTGRVETDPGAMARGWSLLGQVMGTDYSAAAEKFSRPGKASPMLVVDVEKMTGRCSHRKNLAIDFTLWQN